MTHVSLFSGIGGLDLAAEWAGFETVLFCERDPYCQKVLAKHWPGVPIIDDIRSVNRDSVSRPIDVISGGFPCQPHSLAGKRKRNEDERFLWPEMLRVIRELMPAWVVAENVPGIISDGTADEACGDLENQGYEVVPVVSPAHAYGAGFEGYRIFIVASSKSIRHRGLTGEGRGMQAGELVKVKQEGRQAWGETERRIVHTIRNQEALPKDLRGSYGLPDWSHRLRALGNAVVPQQAYPIFKAIRETMNNEVNK